MGYWKNTHESTSIYHCSKVFISRSVRHIINLSWTIEQLLCHCPWWKSLTTLLADLWQGKSYIIFKALNSWLWRAVEWSNLPRLMSSVLKMENMQQVTQIYSLYFLLLGLYSQKGSNFPSPNSTFTSRIYKRVIKNHCLPVL